MSVGCNEYATLSDWNTMENFLFVHQIRSLVLNIRLRSLKDLSTVVLRKQLHKLLWEIFICGIFGFVVHYRRHRVQRFLGH